MQLMLDFICGLLSTIMDRIFPQNPNRPIPLRSTPGTTNSKNSDSHVHVALFPCIVFSKCFLWPYWHQRWEKQRGAWHYSSPYRGSGGHRCRPPRRKNWMFRRRRCGVRWTRGSATHILHATTPPLGARLPYEMVNLSAADGLTHAPSASLVLSQ